VKKKEGFAGPEKRGKKKKKGKTEPGHALFPLPRRARPGGKKKKKGVELSGKKGKKKGERALPHFPSSTPGGLREGKKRKGRADPLDSHFFIFLLAAAAVKKGKKKGKKGNSDISEREEGESRPSTIVCSGQKEKHVAALGSGGERRKKEFGPHLLLLILLDLHGFQKKGGRHRKKKKKGVRRKSHAFILPLRLRPQATEEGKVTTGPSPGKKKRWPSAFGTFMPHHHYSRGWCPRKKKERAHRQNLRGKRKEKKTRSAFFSYTEGERKPPMPPLPLT